LLGVMWRRASGHEPKAQRLGFVADELGVMGPVTESFRAETISSKPGAPVTRSVAQLFTRREGTASCRRKTSEKALTLADGKMAVLLDVLVESVFCAVRKCGPLWRAFHLEISLPCVRSKPRKRDRKLTLGPPGPLLPNVRPTAGAVKPLLFCRSLLCVENAPVRRFNVRGILDGGVVDGGIEAVDPAHKVLNGVVRQRWKAGSDFHTGLEVGTRGSGGGSHGVG